MDQEKDGGEQARVQVKLQPGVGAGERKKGHFFTHVVEGQKENKHKESPARDELRRTQVEAIKDVDAQDQKGRKGEHGRSDETAGSERDHRCNQASKFSRFSKSIRLRASCGQARSHAGPVN